MTNKKHVRPGQSYGHSLLLAHSSLIIRWFCTGKFSKQSLLVRLAYHVRVHRILLFPIHNVSFNRYRWPRDLRRGSAATRLLRFGVRNPPRACISFL